MNPDHHNQPKSGVVVGINIAEREGAPMVSIPSARLHAGKGIEGDRYYTKTGTYSRRPGPGREVTLIEMEALEALKRDYGVAINPGDARRNIVTGGVALNHLVGKTFRVGRVTLRGVSLCEPCSHLARLTQKEVLPGLIHRGGLRAQIVEGGTVKIGDTITY